MALDALRGYVQLANGLTDVTRQRALQTARQLLEQGGDVVDVAVSTATGVGFTKQAQALAEDLIATSRTNRDLLIGLVRTEVERAVARLGLVGADELAAMTRVVERLQSQLDAAIAFGGDLIQSPGHRSGQTPARPRRHEAAPAETTHAETPAGTRAPAKKTAAKKVPAKKTAAKKVPAKKTAAKKVPAKKMPAGPAATVSEAAPPAPPAPDVLPSGPVTTQPLASAPATPDAVTTETHTTETVTTEKVTPDPVTTETVTPQPPSSAPTTSQDEPA